MSDAERMLLLSVDEFWCGRWTGPSTFSVADGRLFPVAEEIAGADGFNDAQRIHWAGTLFPQLVDHHVHLGLIDARALMPHGITVAHDLGWIPEAAEHWVEASAESSLELPTVLIAGAFLTAVGGYPSASSWAPAGACVEIASRSDAVAAVRRQVASGASAVKVTLNSSAGPVFDDQLLGAILTCAHDLRVAVVVHAEGAGQAERALNAGADLLAHAPFSERLTTTVLERMVAAGLSWISTLDIHGWGEPTTARAIAMDNVRRFTLAGGTVAYGTDLGNGPLPAGVNERELLALASAGLGRDSLVSSIAGAASAGAAMARFAFVPGLPPQSAEDTAHWLAGARGCTVDSVRQHLA